jgi:hypothetical protein
MIEVVLAFARSVSRIFPDDFVTRWRPAIGRTLRQVQRSSRTSHLDIRRSAQIVRIEESCQLATRLRDYLQEPIDMLKLDIEGSETEVLMDCADLLINVANIGMEYHAFIDRPQELHIILRLLAQAGFRVYIESVNTVAHPLVRQHEYQGMDTQITIFGYRP